MSRPKPTVLLQAIDPKTYRAEQILQSEAIYAVFYEGKPINLRSLNTTTDDGTKYKKVSFSNPGHAHHLRDKLNKMFHTDKFTVVMLDQGVVLLKT
jgi:hypothetical protein